MPRLAAFVVDGFNLYHSLRAAEAALRASPRAGGATGTRWLDLRGLCEDKLKSFEGRFALGSIHYYTALANHLQTTDPGTRNRQLAHLRCLGATGVICEMSRFKRKDIRCRACGAITRRFEEKETDVAVAMKLTELLHTRTCDNAFLLSGDSDLVPAIRAARRLFPRAGLHVALPYGRASRELQSTAAQAVLLTKDDYLRHQLPDPFELPNGKRVAKPPKW